MAMVEIDDTVWGKMQYCETLEQNIYYVECEHDIGYIVPESYNGEILSQRALSFGETIHGLVYIAYGQYSKPAEIELLEWRKKQASNSMKAEQLQKEIDDCRKFGYIDVPEYFGYYPVPQRTPIGIVERSAEISNGISFVRTGNQCFIAVCYPIWHCELTFIAHRFGQIVEEYMFFNNAVYAIPIYELCKQKQKVAKIVKSYERMEKALIDYFPEYIAEYNLYCYTPSDKISLVAKINNHAFLDLPNI